MELASYECLFERWSKLIPFLLRYKKYAVIAAICVAAILFYFFNRQSSEQPLSIQPILEQPTETPAIKSAEEKSAQASPLETVIIVDVKGAVRNPGIYELSAEERVYDAIMAAGGYKPTANSKVINHAERVKDEMVIYVPKKGEKIDNQVEKTPGSTNTATTATSTETLVNINEADATQLQTLSGIGPSKAEAIIQYRTEHGPFAKVEDLQNVTGFGEKTVERLKPFVTVQ